MTLSMLKRFFNWKYKYFLKKLQGVKWMILDLEFKRFKTKEIREEVRQAYDNNKAKLLSLEMRIAEEKKEVSSGNAKLDGSVVTYEKPKMPLEEVARLEDEVVRMKRDNERFLGQIKAMDLDVEGSRETNEYPDGVSGINQQLDSLRELEGMLKDYMKTL